MTTWQKVLGVLGVAVVVAVIVLLVAGDHGPGRHAVGGAGAATFEAAPLIAVEGADLAFHPDPAD